MKKLKVLQIIPSFDVGGAEKVVLDYLLNQDKGNIEIKAISLYKYNDNIYTKLAKERNLDIIYLDKKPGLDLSIIKKIYKIMKDYKPNIVHTHLYSLKYTIIPEIFLRIKKRFHTIHSRPEKDARGLNKLINYLCFKYLNVTPITLHENMKTGTNNYYHVKNCIVVPNGVDNLLFDNITESKDEIKKSLNISNDEFLIGHVGSFNEVKNHDFIINVFNEIVKHKNARLILIGDGPLKSKMMKKSTELKLDDKIKFLGMRSDVPRILKALDVFLFPSLYEGFPLSLIEAQMAGIKCVVSENIDKSAIVNNNVIQLDLNEDIKNWCYTIIQQEEHESECKIKDVYTIKNVISELEVIYRG